MKYTSLDNIGLQVRKEDGSLSTILAPGNNYPANETGIPKSEFVKVEENNIVLSGIYSENEARYPLIDPKPSVISIPNTTFRFLVKDAITQQLYASEEMYNDLIAAYEEGNPWFTTSTVPTINLDLVYLSTYNQINKFKITEGYADVIVNNTIDTNEKILQYIDWLVKPSLNTDEINLKTIDELGGWEIGASGTFGLGFKELYDSMNRDKEPDPEAIGDRLSEPIYDLSITSPTQIDTQWQPPTPEEVVPRLVEALLEPRKPAFEEVYSPLGEGLGAFIAGALLTTATILLTIGTGGAALPAILAGAASLTPNAVNKITQLLEKKFSGSYIEFIMARTTTRGVTERINPVFQKERRADEKDWNSLLSIARNKLSSTSLTVPQIKAALALAMSAASNGRANDLSYTMKVGRFYERSQTRRFTLTVENPYKISVTQK